MSLERVPTARDGRSKTEGGSTCMVASISALVDNLELAIPVSAVLDTGRRQITYRLTPEVPMNW